jgi:hypothetical protein
METYLGEEPDTQEALEFLRLAEGGDVTHYEVLVSVAKDVKQKVWNKSQCHSQGRKTTPCLVYEVGQRQRCFQVISFLYFFVDLIFLTFVELMLLP